MDDFHNLEPEIKIVKEAQDSIFEESSVINEDIETDVTDLEGLRLRVNALLNAVGDETSVEFDTCSYEELNADLISRFSDFQQLSESDRALSLTPVDYIVAALAGGIAVVVDFLVVKIPKNVKYEGKTSQEGSLLTSLLRKIGQDSNGKESKWISVLEKWFHVNYDSSIREGVFGPRNHRIYSGGHDPSPAGLVFAVKDIISGTFTYFDKSGRLVIEKAEEMGLMEKCFAPIMWLGHLLSDLFTSAGVPIPGGTLLRAIQLGEFGKKGRSFGELIDWMYMNGYDMRHLATMSTSNAAMNLIIGIYLSFISPIAESGSQLLSEREYVQIKQSERNIKMKFVASSVAAAGNVAKIIAYEGNPLAFNYSIWYEMIKKALAEIVIVVKDKSGENAIEIRHRLDDNFSVLISNY